MADVLSGFDVSMYQGGSYSGGGSFAFGLAKATEGVGYQDPAWSRHIAAILLQPIVPGAYHFGRPDLNPGTAGALAEADWFWSVVSTVGGARGMLAVLDLEVGSGPLGQWRDAFLGRLAWHVGGYNPGWYSFWSFVQTRALNYATDAWSWLAWPDANGALPAPNFAVSIQQYGLTSVPGITGSVDANRFFGTTAQLKALTVGGDTGDDPMATGPLSDPNVQQHLIDTVDGTWYFLEGGFDGPTGTPTPPQHYSYLKDVPATLANIQATLANLTPGAVDFNALATALAAHPLTAVLSDAERDAVAVHVLQHLAKDAAAG